MFQANRRKLVKGVVKIRIWEHLLGILAGSVIVVKGDDGKKLPIIHVYDDFLP